MNALIPFRWDGATMTPLPRFLGRCADDFAVGGIYRLRRDKDRSDESHGHYFACIHQAFVNLPERYAERFASEEHLRKWCLIRAGYRNEHTVIAASAAEAREIAVLAGVLDEFAVVHAEDNIVTVWVAKSQKRKKLDGDGMDKEEFEASKEAVLRECSRLIGVDVVALLAQDAPSVAPSQNPGRRVHESA